MNIQDFYSHLHEYLVKPGSAEAAAKAAQVASADVCSSSESNEDLSASQTLVSSALVRLSRDTFVEVSGAAQVAAAQQSGGEATVAKPTSASGDCGSEVQ